MRSTKAITTSWRTGLRGLLADLQTHPDIALAVSCRTSYMDLVLGDRNERSGLVEVVHHGFADFSSATEAIRTFFAHYDIQQPAFPTLNPEFRNPLFLKIVCVSMQNERRTSLPTGFSGITGLFSQYLRSVDERLSRELGYEREEACVQKAADALACRMAESRQDYLTYDDAKGIVADVWPANGGTPRSLFSNLLRGGVLAKVHEFECLGEPGQYVRFTYQRLADHMVAGRLLDRCPDEEGSDPSDTLRGALGFLLSDEATARRHSGWIEALSILLPERAGRELFDVFPEAADWEVVHEGFLRSVIWRDRGAFSATTGRRLEYAARDVDVHAVFDVLLAVATDPGPSVQRSDSTRAIERDADARKGHALVRLPVRPIRVRRGGRHTWRIHRVGRPIRPVKCGGRCHTALRDGPLMVPHDIAPVSSRPRNEGARAHAAGSSTASAGAAQAVPGSGRPIRQ